MTDENDTVSVNENPLHDPFTDVFSLDCILPFECTGLKNKIPQHETVNQHRSNNALLEVLNTQSDQAAFSDEESWEQSSHLRSIEAKIDLTLNWLGKLLLNNKQIPHSKNIKLSRNGVSFISRKRFNVDETVFVSIYVDTQFPQPISLNAIVYRAVECEVGTEITAIFVQVGEEVTDKLEKFIFREQRRGLAKRRHASNHK